jgi:hypothetical protein
LEQLQTRAALDFNCQPAAISARFVDTQTRLATGCGKRAIYVETCSDRNRAVCAWMLNSEIKPAVAPPQPGRDVARSQ